MLDKGYFVGHQDALAYGVNWKYKPGKSDIRDLAGDYPAVYGWELGNLELGADVNLDSVPFNKMKQFIQEGYNRGGIITISWHGTNPYTNNSAWDPTPGSVAAVLPGAEKHEIYKSQLDKIATFMLSLKGKKGELIPVLFRPLHELSGGWFWWGSKSSTTDEFKSLFRFTVEYLRDVKQVHSLLYVYNTGDEFTSEQQFLQRYPGDDIIDLVSFDTYQRVGGLDSTFIKGFESRLAIIEKVAKDKGKISAVAEAGFNQIPYSEWWTEAIAKTLFRHRISYILFWRNAGYKYAEKELEFYVPYQGHPAAANFKKFYELKETLFEKEARASKLYQ